MRFLASCALLLVACAAPLRASATSYPSQSIPVGDIGRDELGPVVQKFDEFVARGDTHVLFRLDSPGGSIFAGLEFIQHVEEAKKTHPLRVSCVVDTMAASMAAVILESGVCDERLMTPRSIILVHRGSIGAQGTAEEVEESVDVLEALNEAMAMTIAARIGMPLEEYEARVAKHAWTMGPREALAFHFVDAVVSPGELPPVAELAEAEETFP